MPGEKPELKPSTQTTFSSSTLSVGSGLQQMAQLAAEQQHAREVAERPARQFNFECGPVLNKAERRAVLENLAAAIAELDKEVKLHPRVKLVLANRRVIFPYPTPGLIIHGNAQLCDSACNRQSMESCVCRGNVPIALLWDEEDVGFRLLPECQGEEWALTFMEIITAAVRDARVPVTSTAALMAQPASESVSTGGRFRPGHRRAL
jgi:hypothetical protein